jgi:ABC-type bacteriocin/lantibiotic exporter with double-glycine peptidase domain
MSHFQHENKELLKNQKKSITLRSAFAPSIEWLGFLTFAVFLYLHSRHGEWSNVDPTFLMQFVIALGISIRPLRNLGEQISKYQETKGALRQNFTAFIAAIPDEHRLDLTRGQPVLPDDIKISKISIDYKNDTKIEATDLSLARGADVVVSGASGSGKSSVLKCLAGLIEPSVWKANVAWADLLSSSSFVSQTPFVFDDSYRRNILYGLQDSPPNDLEIMRLAKGLKLDDLIATPSDLDKELTSYSAELSGGQKQRLTILRALIQSKQILLLDEATSALDVETEKTVLDFLHREMRQRGGRMIFVTHRSVDDASFRIQWVAKNGVIMSQNG